MTHPRRIYGHPACDCIAQTLPMVEARLKAIGAIKHDLSGLVTQGCYRSRNKASAGTHAGGGVWDVKASLVDTPAKRLAWRESGWAMWHRQPHEGPWAAHGHGVVIGCPHLSWAARRQIRAYRRGRNGLRSNRRDQGPRVPIRNWKHAVKSWRKPSRPKPKPRRHSDTPSVSINHLRRARYADPPKPGTGLGPFAGEVRVLETALVKTGWLRRQHVDGHYGTSTVQAVQGFQRKHSHARRPDGWLGPRELRRLFRLARMRVKVTK